MNKNPLVNGHKKIFSISKYVIVYRSLTLAVTTKTVSHRVPAHRKYHLTYQLLLHAILYIRGKDRIKATTLSLPIPAGRSHKERVFELCQVLSLAEMEDVWTDVFFYVWY